jgi:hypothetical protein
MTLRKIAFLLTMMAVLLSITACNAASPKIEEIDQAFDLVIDHLENSSFDGENCLRLVMELSEEAGFQGGWWNTKRTNPVDSGLVREYFSIVRQIGRPGAHTEYRMQWRVYPDGRIEAQHKYPPC